MSIATSNHNEQSNKSLKEELLDKLYLINQYLISGYEKAIRNKSKDEMQFLNSLRYQDAHQLKSQFDEELDSL